MISIAAKFLKWTVGIWLLLGSVALLIMPACATRESALPPSSDSSPTRINISSNPWKAAEIVHESVPSSSIFVGHGDLMLPLYPEGTVIVVQKLLWENLQPGMTAVYESDPENPYNRVCHVLVRKDRDGRWITQGLKNRSTDEITLGSENYVGTVVAAFGGDKDSPLTVSKEELARDAGAYCMIRCHTNGVTHPILPTAVIKAP